MLTAAPAPAVGALGWAATGAGLVLAVLLSACQTSTAPPATDRELLRTSSGQVPGVPLVLPVVLPSGYLFLGPGYEQRDGRRQSSVRTSDFSLAAATESQVVEICVAEPGAGAEVCLPPGSADRAVARSYGAYPVWIRPLGSTGSFSAAERRSWASMSLTDDLDAVTWLT